MKKFDLANLLKKTVQIHAYIMTITFVIYLFISSFKMSDIAITNINNLVQDPFTVQARMESGIRILHNMAFTLVLYKAFIVLLSYAKTMHINIKLILELAIIAPIVELIFNFHSLSYTSAIIYASFTVLISTVYLMFYEKLRDNEH